MESGRRRLFPRSRRLGKKGGVEAHALQVVAEGAGVDAVVEALEPPALVLVVIDLLLGTAPAALAFPSGEERCLVENGAVGLDPAPQVVATGAVKGAQAGEFAETLRELWDLR